jgi:hypothetical protein
VSETPRSEDPEFLALVERFQREMDDAPPPTPSSDIVARTQKILG